MKHKVKVTVLDKKLYPELQRQYCANPAAGACSCYNVGDEFEFCREQKGNEESLPPTRGAGIQDVDKVFLLNECWENPQDKEATLQTRELPWT